MEEIIKQHGQAILIAIISIMLVAILFVDWGGKGSILDYVGSYIAQTQNTNKDYNADLDKQELNVYSNRRYPKAKTKTRVQEFNKNGTTDAEANAIPLLSCFEITDCDGYMFDAASFNPVIDIGKPNGSFIKTDESGAVVDRRKGNVYVKSLYAYADDGTKIDYMNAIYDANYNVVFPTDASYPQDAVNLDSMRNNKYLYVYNKATGIARFPDANTYYTDLAILDYYDVETNCTCYVAVDLLQDGKE